MLGRTDINLISGFTDNIENYAKEIDDCINTFNYVVSHLREWADETTIGAEMLDELKDLNNKVTEIQGYTTTLIQNLRTFTETQSGVNEGNL